MTTLLRELDSLAERRDVKLRLAPGRAVKTDAELEHFLEEVGIALRYHAAESLPLASLYQAAWGGPPVELGRDEMRPAIEMTHALLQRKAGVETNVVADRVCLAHRSIVPALRRLTRSGPAEDVSDLSLLAQRAFKQLVSAGPSSIGGLRRALSVRPGPKDDPLYAAMAELQHAFHVDRGPASVPANGIPYLSPEGYPWRAFHLTHPDLEREAAKLTLEQAAERILAVYFCGATFGLKRKLCSMFRRLLTPARLEAALGELIERGELEPISVPRDTAYVWRKQ